MVEFSYNSARVVRSTNLAAAAYKLTEINSAMRARGGFIYMDYNMYKLRHSGQVFERLYSIYEMF